MLAYNRANGTPDGVRAVSPLVTINMQLLTELRLGTSNAKTLATPLTEEVIDKPALRLDSVNADYLVQRRRLTLRGRFRRNIEHAHSSDATPLSDRKQILLSYFV